MKELQNIKGPFFVRVDNRGDFFVGKCAGVCVSYTVCKLFPAVIVQQKRQHRLGVFKIGLMADLVQVCFFMTQIRAHEKAAIR